MTYQEALEFLFPLHRFGMKPGLDNIQKLCNSVGNPERRLQQVIHIAGTNGKGSTAAMIASMCQEAGLKTALYTSPHLIDFTERIRINGVPIPEARVADGCRKLRDLTSRIQATFFEVTTALALRHFADERVEVCVIETGMGGRLDATNVVQPKYCLITAIGLDHTEHLGDSIGQIAAEKAGIVKSKAKTFTTARQLDALEVITRAAHEKRSPLTFINAVVDSEVSTESTVGELILHLKTPHESYRRLATPLWGKYQQDNVAMAVAVAEDMNLDTDAIRSGLKKVKENTGHRARLEVLSRSPFVVLDVSHNPDGIAATLNSLAAHRKSYEHLYTVFGAMSDKDVKTMVGHLGVESRYIFAAAPKTERALPAEEIVKLCDAQKFICKPFESVAAAIDAARAAASERDMILITGSFYLAGEALAHLEPRAPRADIEPQVTPTLPGISESAIESIPQPAPAVEPLPELSSEITVKKSPLESS